MTLSSLRPPGPLVAYLSEATPEVLAEYLVAFANTDGGTIVMGLDDKGRAVGNVYAEELEGVLRAAHWSPRQQRRLDWAMYSLLPEDLT